MQPTTIYATSLEDVLVPIDAEQNGVPYNPTGDTVEMAFIAPGQVEPAAGDWKPATWETAQIGGSVQYLARCLVGPAGTVTLTAGTYQSFVRITDNPEVPVKRAQNLLIVR